MNMELQINGYKVIGTGEVLSKNDQSIKFRLSDDFVVVFTFIHKDGAQSHFDRSIEKGELIYTFVNFDERGIATNANPSHIGTLNGKEVYLNWRIEKDGGDGHDRVIHYTWWVQDNV